MNLDRRAQANGIMKKMHNNNENWRLSIGIVFIATCVAAVRGQIINRPPQFVPGSGDMSRFSLSENTPVGSPVYQLKGKMIVTRVV